MAPVYTSLRLIDAYVAFFGNEPIPRTQTYGQELQTMREQEESINGRTVAALVLIDPMMTLKVLIPWKPTARPARTTISPPSSGPS